MTQKKGLELPPLSETLVEPDPEDRDATTLELDELWSFVLKDCAQEVDLDGALAAHPPSGGLRHW